jgi:hypothetical protein
MNYDSLLGYQLMHKANIPSGPFACLSPCPEVNKMLCTSSLRNNTENGADTLRDIAHSHNEDVLYLKGVKESKCNSFCVYIRKLQPSLRRFSQNAQLINCIMWAQ